MFKKIFLFGAALFVSMTMAYAADECITVEKWKAEIVSANPGLVFEKDIVLDNPVAVKSFVKTIQAAVGEIPAQYHPENIASVVFSKPTETDKWMILIQFVDKDGCKVVSIMEPEVILEQLMREAALPDGKTT